MFTTTVWFGTAHSADWTQAALSIIDLHGAVQYYLSLSCLLTLHDVLHGTYRVKDVLSEQGIVATRVDKQRGWDIAIVQVNSEQTRVGGSMGGCAGWGHWVGAGRIGLVKQKGASGGGR